MLDDEMKKWGITETSGDWGSLRLFCLAFKHPALLCVPTQTLLHPQLPGWRMRPSLLFFPLCRHQIGFVLLPNIPKWVFFFFFLSWGFSGSLLAVKTPYVGFNSGYMFCAASVVPASVSSSAISAGDDSVACFAFCSKHGLCTEPASVLLLLLVFVPVSAYSRDTFVIYMDLT